MKVQMFSRSENQLERNEYNDKVIIKIDGQTVFNVHDGAIEDNNLGRNFQDVYKILDLLKQAHEAGVNGEELGLDYDDLEE